jgi:hypothetical protein
MDDVRLALLGDKAAQERLTDAGWTFWWWITCSF